MLAGVAGGRCRRDRTVDDTDGAIVGEGRGGKVPRALHAVGDIAALRTIQRLIGEGINHAGIKRIIELESAMANMAIEVAKLRIEVDALISENPQKSLAIRRKSEVIIYKEDN